MLISQNLNNKNPYFSVTFSFHCWVPGKNLSFFHLPLIFFFRGNGEGRKWLEMSRFFPLHLSLPSLLVSTVTLLILEHAVFSSFSWRILLFLWRIFWRILVAFLSSFSWRIFWRILVAFLSLFSLGKKAMVETTSAPPPAFHALLIIDRGAVGQTGNRTREEGSVFVMEKVGITPLWMETVAKNTRSL